MWPLCLDQLSYIVAGVPSLSQFASVMSFFFKFLIFFCVRRGAQIPVTANEVFAQRAVIEFMLLNHNKELITNENRSKFSFYFSNFLHLLHSKIFNFVKGSPDISE